MRNCTPRDTARRTYIRLLSQVAQTVPGNTNEDTVLMGELIEANFLTGGVARDGNGHIMAVQETGITVEGRLFLQRLKSEEREEKLLHKSLKYLPIAIGYIAGLLSPLFTDWQRAVNFPH
jgi:hypothetical protein